jgi:hypothetical protein
MKKYIKHLSLLAGVLFTLSFAALAQPGFDDDVEDTPIDGGVGLLVGAGIVYGIKRVHQLGKKNKQDA